MKTEQGLVGSPISIAGVEIAAGDHVVADEDGVVITPRALLAEVAAQVEAIATREAELVRAFAAGGTSFE